MKILIAGEGVHELGSWAKEPEYRNPAEPGVIVAFLQRLRPKETVVDGRLWKSIVKYAAGDHAKPEARNVLGLALRAAEAKLDALVFLRDRDGDAERERDLRDGISRAMTMFPELRIAGGIPIECLEAWMLGLLGHAPAERLSRPAEYLESAFGKSTRLDFVEIVELYDINRIPRESASLRAWVETLQSL